MPGPCFRLSILDWEVASTTDENSQSTSYAYDILKRLTTITRPDNAQITYSYTDATPPAQSAATVSAPIQGTSVRKQTNSFNGLGLAAKTTVLDASLTFTPSSKPSMTRWGGRIGYPIPTTVQRSIGPKLGSTRLGASPT